MNYQKAMREVAEMIRADLIMVAERTQALDHETAWSYGWDIQAYLESQWPKIGHTPGPIQPVSIELWSPANYLMAYSYYTFHCGDISYEGGTRPGHTHKWPVVAGGHIRVRTAHEMLKYAMSSVKEHRKYISFDHDAGKGVAAVRSTHIAEAYQ